MAEKTPPPFPTKEEILNYIRENPAKASKREIARAFGLKNDARIKLKKLVRSMTLDGELAKGHKAKLHISDEIPPVLVVQITGTDRFGDLIASPVNTAVADTEKAPEIYISAHDKKASLAIGSRALVRISPHKDKSGYSAKIIRILEGESTILLGVFTPDDDHIAYVKPTDKKDRNQYLIAKSDWNGAKENDLVLIEIISRSKDRRSHKAKNARVRECLGALSDPRSVSLIAIHTHGIPNEFSEQALLQAEASKEPTLGDVSDLRHIPLITVDPEDARDHDDAIWAEMTKDGGCHVLIAIADVARYVTPASAIDKEAIIRGNSVYFPDRVVPMIPERLSNRLCSLQEDKDRYTLAVHIYFDHRGKKIKHKFVRALMRSHGSLSYEEFQAAHEGEVSERAAPLLQSVIEPLYRSYEILLKGRKHREPLELSVTERKIKFDDKGNIESILPRISIEAHKLVEEFMIQANVAAAEELQRKGAICMYRVHEEPSFDKIENLREFLESLDHVFAKGQVIRPKVFNNFLNKVKGTPQEEVINTIILRTQMKAVYTDENIGHFGLSLTNYAHFTSPIRRYADILVHRSLIKALKLGDDGLSDHDFKKFKETAEHISTTERTAMLAERESTDRYVAAFMKNNIDEYFEGRIAGVSRAGLFVALTESGGDGFVPISSIMGDYFHHNQDHHMLEGERTGLTYQLGDQVTVRLKEAAPITGGLILQLRDEKLDEAAAKSGKGSFRGRVKSGGKGRGGAKSNKRFSRRRKPKG